MMPAYLPTYLPTYLNASVCMMKLARTINEYLHNIMTYLCVHVEEAVTL